MENYNIEHSIHENGDCSCLLASLVKAPSEKFVLKIDNSDDSSIEIACLNRFRGTVVGITEVFKYKEKTCIVMPYIQHVNKLFQRWYK